MDEVEEELINRCNLKFYKIKRILVCKTCSIVLGSELVYHLKTHSITISKSEAALLQQLTYIDGKYMKPVAELVDPVEGFPILDGFRCKSCVYYASCKSALYRHNRNHHKGKKNYERCHVQRLFPKGVHNHVGVITGADTPNLKHASLQINDTVERKRIKKKNTDENSQENNKEFRIGEANEIKDVNRDKRTRVNEETNSKDRILPEKLLEKYNLELRNDGKIMACKPCNKVLGTCFDRHVRNHHKISFGKFDLAAVAALFPGQNEYSTVPTEYTDRVVAPMEGIVIKNGYRCEECCYYAASRTIIVEHLRQHGIRYRFSKCLVQKSAKGFYFGVCAPTDNIALKNDTEFELQRQPNRPHRILDSDPRNEIIRRRILSNLKNLCHQK